MINNRRVGCHITFLSLSDCRFPITFFLAVVGSTKQQMHQLDCYPPILEILSLVREWFSWSSSLISLWERKHPSHHIVFFHSRSGGGGGKGKEEPEHLLFLYFLSIWTIGQIAAEIIVGEGEVADSDASFIQNGYVAPNIYSTICYFI